MSLLSEMRAISRRTGSNALTITTPGVSSMITSTPVAFSNARMFRPSRPMMRPFISSLGISTVLVVASAVWEAAKRWIEVSSISLALASQIAASFLFLLQDRVRPARGTAPDRAARAAVAWLLRGSGR